ncbi:hypothetical protein M0Q50_06545 [bacterium]|jgi:hypothetical protein|nr:hypothetical protein [bacterium]
MNKILCENLKDYRRMYLYEADDNTDVSINQNSKIQHPVKTLRTLLSMPYEDFITTLKQNANDPKLQAIMNLGRKDGIPTDETVKIDLLNIPVKNLLPTQSQIGLEDSLGFLRKQPGVAVKLINGDTSGFENMRILVANNKYILDGHHRWSQVFLMNPDADIPVVNLNIPGFKDPKQLLKIIQLAIAAAYKNIASTNAHSATDLFADSMGPKEIKELVPKIMSGELYSPPGEELIKDCIDAFSKKYNQTVSRQQLFDLISKRAIFIREHRKPKTGTAPERSYMPQPSDAATAAGMDPKGLKGVPIDFVSKLKSGQLNFKHPLVMDKSRTLNTDLSKKPNTNIQ